MSRITITLDMVEKKALTVLSEREFRDPRAQAALIIRQELERRGFLITRAQVYSDSDDAKQERIHAND